MTIEKITEEKTNLENTVNKVINEGETALTETEREKIISYTERVKNSKKQGFFLERSQKGNIKILNKRKVIAVLRKGDGKVMSEGKNVVSNIFSESDFDEISEILEKGDTIPFVKKITVTLSANRRSIKAEYCCEEDVTAEKKSFDADNCRTKSTRKDVANKILNPKLKMKKTITEPVLKQIKETVAAIPVCSSAIEVDENSPSFHYLFDAERKKIIRFLSSRNREIRETEQKGLTLKARCVHDVKWIYDHRTGEITGPEIDGCIEMLQEYKKISKVCDDVIRRCREACKVRKISIKDGTLRFTVDGGYVFKTETGSAYRQKLNAFLKDVQKKKDEKKKQELERYQRIPCFGSVTAMAILQTVINNERYITESMCIKELRGMKLPYHVNFAESEYSGLFNDVSTEEMQDIIECLLKHNILTTYTLKGTYGRFDILKTTLDTKIFMDQCRKVTHRRMSDMTEYELQDILLHSDPKNHTEQWMMDRLDLFLDKKGLVCFRREDFIRFLRDLSDSAKQYIKTLAKIEDDRSQKIYLNKIYKAAI